MAEPTAPDERPENDWIAAHAFYHDPLDPMLVEAVAPLVAELRERDLAEDWFFLRYWDGGPHLRFRVLPPASAYAETRELIRDRFERFLGEHPSTTGVEPADYQRSAERIARWEGQSDYAEPRPNNTVEFWPYVRERHRYGHGLAMTAVERHFTESSRLAIRLLAGPNGALDAGQRFTAAYSMLVLAWLSYRDDPAWRSAWAEMDTYVPIGGETDQDELERRWQAQRSTLCTLTGRLRAVVERAEAGAGTGDLADWARSIARLKQTLTAEAAAGRFEPPARAWEGAGPIEPGTAVSVLPVVDICAHLFCNRLGLSLADESYLRVLAMRAVRETEGETHAVAGDSRLLP